MCFEPSIRPARAGPHSLSLRDGAANGEGKRRLAGGARHQEGHPFPFSFSDVDSVPWWAATLAPFPRHSPSTSRRRFWTASGHPSLPKQSARFHVRGCPRNGRLSAFLIDVRRGRLGYEKALVYLLTPVPIIAAARPVEKAARTVSSRTEGERARACCATAKENKRCCGAGGIGGPGVVRSLRGLQQLRAKTDVWASRVCTCC